MKKSMGIRKLVPALAGILLAVAFGSVHEGWAKDKAPIAKSKSLTLAQATDKSGMETSRAQYVGADTCITCHQDNGDSLLHSAHGRLMETRKGVPFQRSCETCHGPGSLHVEGADDPSSENFKTIKLPTKMASADANATCLSCHQGRGHLHWKGSAHDMRDVTCVSCHSVHQDLKKPNAHLMKTEKVADTCFTCHIEKKGQMARNAHMPVSEGDMSCTSCHDMHGTEGLRNLKGDSVNETCFKCHADKRGPFLNEHPPSRESCLTCHNPHGGHNENMLVEKEPFLCQRCHDPNSGHPPTAYDNIQLTNRSNRLIGKSCTNCHSLIHGSNHPSGRYYQR